jgi:methionine-gamma-lyase
MSVDQHRIDTIVVHAGADANPTSAVTTPVFQTSTYSFDSPEALSAANQAVSPINFYGRYSSPNLLEVELVIAKLEGAASARVVGSGMAASSLLLLTHAKAGGHMVAQRTVYPTVAHLFKEVLPRLGVEVTIVNQTDLGEFERAIRADTALVYVETPANPTLALTDLDGVAKLTRAQAPGAVCVCDSTFASPFNAKPLQHGFDYVMHSATKYLGGHSDLVAGVVAARSVELIDKLWPMYIALGAVLHPQEAFLLCRGIKTFGLRMRAHNANALKIAAFLETHAKVARVFYPGLPSHPQHDLARRQMPGGFGGMVAFDLRGGRDAGFRFLSAVKGTLTLAVSLGGVHTLVTHPASTTAVHLSEDELHKSGILPGLVRLSVGTEDADDLLADLQRALDGI